MLLLFPHPFIIYSIGTLITLLDTFILHTHIQHHSHSHTKHSNIDTLILHTFFTWSTCLTLNRSHLCYIFLALLLDDYTLTDFPLRLILPVLFGSVYFTKVRVGQKRHTLMYLLPVHWNYLICLIYLNERRMRLGHWLGHKNRISGPMPIEPAIRWLRTFRKGLSVTEDNWFQPYAADTYATTDTIYCTVFTMCI